MIPRLGMVIEGLPLCLGEDTVAYRKRYPGKVVYIHPTKRYLIAELQLPNGRKLRECYYLRPLPAAKGKGKKGK